VPTPNILASFNCSFNLLGQQASFKTSFLGSAAPVINEILSAGATGVLTTRTDAHTGTLTMNPGHGITTGQRLDIYWTLSGISYVMRNCLVGTVSGNSVPFTNVNSLGDALPIATTPIIASVPVVGVLSVLSSSVLLALFCQAQGPCMLDFSSSATATINSAGAEVFPLAMVNTPFAYGWMLGSEAAPYPPTPHGDTTGITGGTTAAVYMSNGLSTPNNVVILPLIQ
jgi:hypothetical protein